MDDYFEFAKAISRASATNLMPDATAGIDRHNDDCARRADMLEAAKDSDISALAESYLDTTDAATARALVEWFIEEMIADGNVVLIQRIQAAGGFFSALLMSAAKKKAESDWTKKYFK